MEGDRRREPGKIRAGGGWEETVRVSESCEGGKRIQADRKNVKKIFEIFY